MPDKLVRRSVRVTQAARRQLPRPTLDIQGWLRELRASDRQLLEQDEHRVGSLAYRIVVKLTLEQQQWLLDEHINLSRFVRLKLQTTADAEPFICQPHAPGQKRRKHGAN